MGQDEDVVRDGFGSASGVAEGEEDARSSGFVAGGVRRSGGAGGGDDDDGWLRTGGGGGASGSGAGAGSRSGLESSQEAKVRDVKTINESGNLAEMVMDDEDEIPDMEDEDDDEEAIIRDPKSGSHTAT